MNIFTPIDNHVLDSGFILRLSLSNEGIYFIHKEKNVTEDIDGQWSGVKTQKEMLWNGDKVEEAHLWFEHFKSSR